MGWVLVVSMIYGSFGGTLNVHTMNFSSLDACVTYGSSIMSSREDEKKNRIYIDLPKCVNQNTGKICGNSGWKKDKEGWVPIDLENCK